MLTQTLCASSPAASPNARRAITASQGGPVPRRLRQNSRLAPVLLAGLAAAQLGLLPAPESAAVAAEQQQRQWQWQHTPAANVAVMLQEIGLSALVDSMSSVALAFDSFPAGLLDAPAPAAQQLQQEQAYKLRHMNQHGFCYSRMLCGKSGPAGAELAPGA